MKDYVSIGEEYAREALNGRILTSRLTQKAFQRYFDDLDNYVKRGVYLFDRDKANYVCSWMENLQHTKGPLGGQNFTLEPWQCFVNMNIYGFLKPSGFRRFKYGLMFVPRGNGKSYYASCHALYFLCADGEVGADCFSFATKQAQARIVFDTSRDIVRVNENLKNYYGILDREHCLIVPSTKSTFKPMSSNSKKMDGLNVHFANLDEIHEFPDASLYDVVKTGMSKRKQPFMLCISTAGFDVSGFGYQTIYKKAEDILNGERKANDTFALIYTIDPDDDWRTYEAAKKANPNLDVSTFYEEIESAVNDAVASGNPSAENNIKTKYFNVWCSAGSAWVSLDTWDANKRDLTLDDFEGEECFIGLDLSSKNDITAKVLVFPRMEDDGKVHYYVFGDYFLPELQVEKSPNTGYKVWESEGYITATDGGVIDYGVICENIRDDLQRFNVRFIAYDSWNAQHVVNELDKDGANMLEIGMRNISEPMKLTQALIDDGRLHHDGNPALRWMISNVVEKRKANDFVKPEKQRYENKIDGAVAMLQAMSVASKYGLKPEEVTAKKTFDFSTARVY